MKRPLDEVIPELLAQHGIDAMLVALVSRCGRKTVTAALRATAPKKKHNRRGRVPEMIPVDENYRVWLAVKLEQRRREMLGLPKSIRVICQRRFRNGYEYEYCYPEMRFDLSKGVIPFGPSGTRKVGGRLKVRKGKATTASISVRNAYNHANKDLWRRIYAAMKHHHITKEDVADRLWLAAPSDGGLKLATVNERAKLMRGDLAVQLAQIIKQHGIALVCIDPLVRAHGVEENSNTQMDFVVSVLTGLAEECNCAVDVPHHMSKGTPEPGNANRARGASAFIAGVRLAYTMTPCSEAEAAKLGATPVEQRFLRRVDGAKLNIAPPATEARWFMLRSVDLGNADEHHPNGDKVQTVEVWTPRGPLADLGDEVIDAIIESIDRGWQEETYYSTHHLAKNRRAWPVVQEFLPDVSKERAQAIIKALIESGRLVEDDWQDKKTRNWHKGLRCGGAPKLV